MCWSVLSRMVTGIISKPTEQKPELRVQEDDVLSPHCSDFFTLQDAKGLVDFRNVALALAALDGGRSLEELTRLAFEVPLRDRGRAAEMRHPTAPSQEGSVSYCSS